MSATEPPKAPTAPPLKPSGATSALRYTGIPTSWLQKRPKLPSRNWLIFWSVLGSVTSLYIYDRREAKRIRQSYVEKVQWRAEEKLNPLELPRKVRVYACRWPGDDDHNRSMKYFRRYVKPILVAAAVDFEMINGNRHGGLARSIADKIKSQRRESLPPDHPLRQNNDPPIVPLPSTLTPAQQRDREMQGGILIVGRHTLKEYLHGIRLGWTEGIDDVDQEEALAHQLAGDGVFDEPEIQVAHDSIPGTQDEPEPLGKPSVFAPGSKSPLFSHVLAPSTSSPSRPPDHSQAPKSNAKLPVPHEIPPQPPFLLLPFQNLLGFRYIPHMIVDFFNERRRAQLGAEAAYTLLEGQTRDFIPPEKQDELDHLPMAPRSLDMEGLETLVESFPTVGPQGGDLDFDLAYEKYIPKSYNKTPKNIADARKKYYEALPGKLAVARSLARGDREPTKDEREHPPPSEVELTTERFKKELKWREELDGWKLLRRGSGVSWDSRLADALRVYKPPSSVEI